MVHKNEEQRRLYKKLWYQRKKAGLPTRTTQILSEEERKRRKRERSQKYRIKRKKLLDKPNTNSDEKIMIGKYGKEHIKKRKGDIGISNAIANLTEQGWFVSIPISEHTKYDLIAEKNGICKRVQVRYTTPKNNVMRVKLKTNWVDKNGSHVRKRKKGDFDVLAAYNPQNKDVYYLHDSEFENKTNISIRLTKPKSNQRNVWMGYNYLKMDV